jgi:hypothetical protein
MACKLQTRRPSAFTGTNPVTLVSRSADRPTRCVRRSQRAWTHSVTTGPITSRSCSASWAGISSLAGVTNCCTRVSPSPVISETSECRNPRACSSAIRCNRGGSCLMIEWRSPWISIVSSETPCRFGGCPPLERAQRDVLARLTLEQPRPPCAVRNSQPCQLRSRSGWALEKLRSRVRARVLDRVRSRLEHRTRDGPHQFGVEGPQQFGFITASAVQGACFASRSARPSS